jgi:hypothetical protein
MILKDLEKIRAGIMSFEEITGLKALYDAVRPSWSFVR